MPRTMMAATLLACLTFTAGCGGSSPDASSTPPAAAPTTTEAAPTTPASELEGLSAAEVWEKLESDVGKAKSVHLSANVVDGKDRIKFNMKLASSGNATGTMTNNGDTVNLRRIGKTLYFKGDRGFWTNNVDPASAKTMAGKWIKTTKGKVAGMEGIFVFTDLDSMLKESLKTTPAEKKALKIIPGIPVDGQETIGLSTKSADLDQLYAAATGPTLPLKITAAKDKKQFMKFQDWDKDFTVEKPAGAIDINAGAS